MGMLVAGVKTSTGATAAPAVEDPRVIEDSENPGVMAGAVMLAEGAVSTLDDIVKPGVVAARAAPRVSPLIVIVTAEVPVATPAVVRTIEVLVAVAAVEDVACKFATVLAMEVTIPKK